MPTIRPLTMAVGPKAIPTIRRSRRTGASNRKPAWKTAGVSARLRGEAAGIPMIHATGTISENIEIPGASAAPCDLRPAEQYRLHYRLFFFQAEDGIRDDQSDPRSSPPPKPRRRSRLRQKQNR